MERTDRIYFHLANQLIKSFASPNQSKQTINGYDCFRYEPLDMDLFIKTLEKAKQFNRRTFLDVGAGIGDKVYAARLMGLASGGVEIDENYVREAKRIFGVSLYRCDALEFTRYQEYDLIYFFTPIATKKKQNELEAKIYREALAGTIVMDFGKNLPQPGWEVLDRNLKRKL